ncbi:MAG TPA: PAS domain S-box protein [Desulfomonilaceae bacterium]|nr:PAS domain S-box protein [Desulfomonilaceae bacterium]
MGTSLLSGRSRWPWIALFVGATFALLAAGYAYFVHETERISQDKCRQLAAIARLKTDQVEQWRKERILAVWTSANSPFFKKVLSEWLQNRDDTALRKALQDRYLLDQEMNSHADAELFDLDGNIVLSAKPRPQSLHPAEKRTVDEALSHRTAKLSDLFLSSEGGIHMAAIAPVLDQGGNPIGVVAVRSNAESRLYPLIQSWPIHSPTAETLLVRREGEEVVFLNDLRHRPNSALSLREPLTRSDLPAVQAVMGKQGLFQGRDYRGVSVMAYLRPIAESPWFMVAKADTAEILEEAGYRGLVTALFAILFILFAAGVTAYGYRHRQARLYQNLYRSEREKRQAQERFRITLYSIGEAVITTDTGGLVQQMNPVAERLTGWLEDEARGKSVDEVFHIVNESSRALRENPVQRVLSKGIVVGLANDTLLIARDGTERPIADSGAPIRDENGDISGVVLVFRDQSEERAAQKALRDSEVRYRTLFERARDGIMIIDLEADKAGHIVAANPVAAATHGYELEEMLSLKITDLDTPESAEKAQERFQRILSGEWLREEVTHRKKDGSIFPIELSAGLIKLENNRYSLAIERDISDRKRVEGDLRESEKRYRSLFENMLDGFAYCKMLFQDGNPHDFVYLDVNSSFERLTGLQNVIGKRVTEVIPRLKETNSELFEIYGRVASTGNPEKFEAYVDSMGIWFSVSAYSRGKDHFVALFDNITERKQAEEALRKSEERSRFLARALELSSQPFGVSYIDGTLGFFNRAYCNLLGYPEEKMRQKGWETHLTPPEYREWEKAKLAELARTGEPARYEKEYIRKDGSHVPVELLVHVDREENGDRLCFYSFITDLTERKRAEEALRASEEQYRAVFDNAGIGIDLLDGDGRILQVNQALANMLGYTAEEFRQLTFEDITHPEDRESSKRLLKALSAGEIDVYTLEKRYLKKDGSILWGNLSTSAIRDANGRHNRTVGVVADITERKKAEGALRESEVRYRTVADFTYDWEYWVDEADSLLYVSPSCERITGYSAQEFVDNPGLMEDIVHPDDREDVVNHFHVSRKADDDVSYSLDFRIIHRNGRILWINHACQPVRGQDGQPLGRRACNRDITDRKRSELAQRRLATAVEQAVEAIVITDTQANIQYVNPAFERITGYSREEILGEKPTLLTSEDYDSDFTQGVQDTLSSGKSWAGRLVKRRKDGSHYEEDVTISPVRDSSGTVINFVAVKRDVSHEVQLQRQLLQAQKMEAIGTLAGGIAHDFNNILQVALGYSELLLIGKSGKDPDYADLQKIQHSARSGADLVRSLLTFSRKVEPKLVPMSLNRQVLNVEKLLRRTIPKMIDIRLELAKDLKRTNADTAQIEQVIMNLAVNARDAMGERGSLTIRTEGATVDAQYCRLHVDAVPGDYVVLSVSDTGHGMDRQTLLHIFEPFYTTKELGRGTGLGLAMVYGIVKQHGGHLTCYSEVEKGTTFKVYLPVFVTESEVVPDPTVEIPAEGNETVLLVDDEDPVRELGERILTKNGYDVLTATNGVEALELYLAQREKIDLIILDLIMPAMGGKDCLKELLKIDPHVKVIVASGFAADTSAGECIDDGAKGFVAKPFRFKELLNQVRKALDES